MSMGSMTPDRERGISAETAGFRRHFSGVHIGVLRPPIGVHDDVQRRDRSTLGKRSKGKPMWGILWGKMLSIAE